MTKTRRGFTDEFKCEAIKLVKRPGAKVSQTARDLGIDQRVLRRWLEQERGGVLDTRPSRPIRSETTSEGERLQRDLRRVTMGRDLLKKARVRSISQGNTRAASVSTGVAKPSVMRGLELSCLMTAASSLLAEDRQVVPLGNYWRRSPLVFSLVPRCHGLRGSQKYT